MLKNLSLKFSTVLFFLFIVSQLTQAQIYGTVRDNLGEVLAYASVYKAGSTVGTTTNNEGNYTLQIPKGKSIIQFQYVGYKTIKKEIDYAGDPIELNITLSPEAVSIESIVIAADAEDPAYAIMRKAIRKREYHKEGIKKYESDLYIKGSIKVLDAPEKFMGQEIGDMEGILDSTKQGFIYLSESSSKFYWMAPNKTKEIMSASKISGDDNGFSFNSYTASDFQFYDEYIQFSRSIIGPLADVSLRNYKFRLEGSFFDQEGRMINKIKVIPKSSSRPLFFGHIYIVEDTWNIYEVDLSLTGKAMKVQTFDTIRIKQIFIPLNKSKDTKWVLFNQIIDFSAGIFAFKFGGAFSYVFSNHDINPSWGSERFDNELFKIEKDAPEKDSSYWATNRPIPLTDDEALDYVKKDSLQILWKSEEYLDSIDRVANKFTFTDLLFGYSLRNSFKHRYFTINSPLGTFLYNKVQGAQLGLDLKFTQWNKKETSYFRVEPNLNYSFSEKRLRPFMKLSYRSDDNDRKRFQLSIGRKVDQFNEKNPINYLVNTWNSLFVKNDRLKIFEQDVFDINYREELLNGFNVIATLGARKRRPLTNTTDFSFFKKDRAFESNLPREDLVNDFFQEHQTNFFELQFYWKPIQKYMTVGERKISLGSKYPKFGLNLKKGFRGAGSTIAYNKLRFSLEDQYLNVNQLGYLKYSIEYGTFLGNTDDIEFIDLFHFSGNEFSLANTDGNLKKFRLPRNYEFSSAENYSTIFSEWHAEGFVLDRLPVIRNLGLKSVFGFNGLYRRDTNYFELLYGVDNVGIGVLRLFRLDFIWGFKESKYYDFGIQLGAKMTIGG